jgi:hypothetical protein
MHAVEVIPHWGLDVTPWCARGDTFHKWTDRNLQNLQNLRSVGYSVTARRSGRVDLKSSCRLVQLAHLARRE